MFGKFEVRRGELMFPGLDLAFSKFRALIVVVTLYRYWKASFMQITHLSIEVFSSFVDPILETSQVQ